MSLAKIEPSELSAEPIRADSLIFLDSPDLILHLEFQTTTNENMPLRMLDYWVRLRRKFPTKEIHQTVIYLKSTNSPLAYQDNFIAERTTHSFDVIRLWEQPTAIFQQSLGLLPFVVLSQTNDPEETLRQAAKQIAAITDLNLQANLAAATSIISGLKLDLEVIQRIIRRDIMKESVTYQAILQEGRAEGEAIGEARGEAIGKAEAANQIALNMLNSNISLDLIAQFTGLSLEQIQQLQQESRENNRESYE
jgi:predicted transposase/invertase (TIGR01784 family)